MAQAIGCDYGSNGRDGNIAERLNCNDFGFKVSGFKGFTMYARETMKP
jgi:hypothetical protein